MPFPRLMVMILGAVLVAGCSTLDRLPAAVENQRRTANTTIYDIPDARFVPGEDTAAIRAGWIAQERRRRVVAGRQPVEHMLALSGGGENGAFGAGLLIGWTARGDRPSFDLVTGVSTGALIAPLAFLGPRYDATLKALYTTIGFEDVARVRPILTVINSDGVADTSPLFALIERHLTDDMIAEIAAEHRKGRVLLVGTTNLDAGRAVIWNIGAIAASGNPRGPHLIRRILLASASIPGVFPPVMFDVTVNGEARQEMHVDGGTSAQLFLYPTDIPMRTAPADVRDRRRVAWIVRNGRTRERPEQTARGLVPIAQRSIATLIVANSMGDIYRTYLATRRDGVDFNLAFITSEFTSSTDKPFDREYMNKLFDYGYRLMREGRSWAKAPPGFVP